jgi:hypothetical protein
MLAGLLALVLIAGPWLPVWAAAPAASPAHACCKAHAKAADCHHADNRTQSTCDNACGQCAASVPAATLPGRSVVITQDGAERFGTTADKPSSIKLPAPLQPPRASS